MNKFRVLVVLLTAAALLPAAGRAQLNAEPLSACRSGLRPYEASDGLQLLGELPRLWRILEQAGNPNLELTLFGVGRRDDARADEILREMGFDENPRTVYGVERVPTFIFRRDGVELGRIVETPTATLERDAAVFCAAGPGRSPEPAWR